MARYAASDGEVRFGHGTGTALEIVPLRIAQVCPYDFDRPGGVQAHIRDTAEALGALGHEVTIIAPRVGDGPAVRRLSGNVRLVRVGRSWPIRLSGTRFEASVALGQQRSRLRAVLRETFDVVHYHSMLTPVLPLQVLAGSRSPSVVTFHETPPDTLGGAIGRLLLSAASRLVMAWVDGAIAVSEAPRAHLKARSGQRLWIAPPCTDLQRFRPTEACRREPSERVTILFVGRLEPRKGAMLLLESYRRLEQEGLPVRLVIAGAGAEAQALRDFIARHGLAHVTLLGRFDDADAPGLYASADIFCAPAPYGESFGIVLAEAMASGKPVVAAANKGYRTVLTGEGAELLARPGDVGSLYLQLKKLVDSPELRARFAAWGEAESRKYDARVFAPVLAQFYRRAMSAARPAPARRPGRMSPTAEIA